MENTWFVIVLIVALFFIFSGTALRSSGRRRPPAEARAPRVKPVYTANDKPARLPEYRRPNMAAQAAPPVSTPALPGGTGVRARVVKGSDYLLSNPQSHRYSFRVGAAGEQRVVTKMESMLGRQWTIFRNVELGDEKGDIDIVLVGLGGIWALEVKTYTGNFQVKRGSWYKKTANGHMKIERGPCAQVRTNAIRLCRYLKRHGVTHSIERAVVMSGSATVDIVSTGTPIWKLEDLEAQLSSRTNGRRLSHDRMHRVISVLERASMDGARLH